MTRPSLHTLYGGYGNLSRCVNLGGWPNTIHSHHPHPAVPECTLPVDVVLRSGDGVLIGAHQTNLGQYSEGFPPASLGLDATDPVDLPESGSTLGRLMQFMHKHRYPRISKFPWGIYELAETAQKYEVYTAIAACNEYIECVNNISPCQAKLIRCRAHATKEPLLSLSYGTKFKLPHIADAAASSTLYCTLTQIKAIPGIDDATVYAWVREYFDRPTFCVPARSYFVSQLQLRSYSQECFDDMYQPPKPYINRKQREHECWCWNDYLSRTKALIPPHGLHWNNFLKSSADMLISPLRVNRGVLDCGICADRASRWEEKILDAIAASSKISTYFPHS